MNGREKVSSSPSGEGPVDYASIIPGSNFGFAILAPVPMVLEYGIDFLTITHDGHGLPFIQEQLSRIRTRGAILFAMGALRASKTTFRASIEWLYSNYDCNYIFDLGSTLHDESKSRGVPRALQIQGVLILLGEWIQELGLKKSQGTMTEVIRNGTLPGFERFPQIQEQLASYRRKLGIQQEELPQ